MSGTGEKKINFEPKQKTEQQQQRNRKTQKITSKIDEKKKEKIEVIIIKQKLIKQQKISSSELFMAYTGVVPQLYPQNCN